MTHLQFYLKWNKVEEKYEVDFMLSNMPKQEVIITMDLKQALIFANNLNDSIVDKMHTIIDTIPKLYDKKETNTETIRCPICGGTGGKLNTRGYCGNCRGTGVIPKQQDVCTKQHNYIFTGTYDDGIKLYVCKDCRLLTHTPEDNEVK